MSLKKLNRSEKPNLITISESLLICASGAFIDGVEYGYFATSTEYDTYAQVDPSELLEMHLENILPPQFTHVLWITK